MLLFPSSPPCPLPRKTAGPGSPPACPVEKPHRRAVGMAMALTAAERRCISARILCDVPKTARHGGDIGTSGAGHGGQRGQGQNAGGSIGASRAVHHVVDQRRAGRRGLHPGGRRHLGDREAQAVPCSPCRQWKHTAQAVSYSPRRQWKQRRCRIATKAVEAHGTGSVALRSWCRRRTPRQAPPAGPPPSPPSAPPAASPASWSSWPPPWRLKAPAIDGESANVEDACPGNAE